MAVPDFKQPARQKASQADWDTVRADKLVNRLCRVCMGPATSLHHMVPRSLGGDDVADNLVPLCGTGTTGCHGLVEARNPVACGMLRDSLSVLELQYVVFRKSLAFLDSYYPQDSGRETMPGSAPATPLSAAAVELARPDAILQTIDLADLEMSPPAEGEDCALCQRRVPHKRKETSPKDTAQLNIGTGPRDAVEITKTRLDDFAELAGLKAKPHYRFKSLDVLLDIALPVNADTLQAIVEQKDWPA
jgi:hypothetical protein